MQIAVIGAGIVGVTTAYELAMDGHQVTVFERRPSVAAETSFANAGVLSPGYVTPWAAPGMPAKVIAGLFTRHSAVRFGAGTAAISPWIWRYLRACRKGIYARNRAAMHCLAQFSQSRIETLTSELKLQYEQSKGLLILLRAPRDLTRAQKNSALLSEFGVAHHIVDATRARQLEPSLNVDTALQAAIHLPQDGAGNCRQFAHLLKAQAQVHGANFEFGRDVQHITGEPRPEVTWRAVDTDAAASHSDTFDAVVVCAGSQAVRLLSPLGLRLPLIPIYGYSVTAPVRHHEAMPDRGPHAALIDERYKVAVTRLGQRIRVAGGAEVGGSPEHHSHGALSTLYKVLEDWFPGAVDLGRVQHWKGARPMLPDGPPVIGASGVPGIWLNIGHGSSGWALSCGSARVVADQLARRVAAVDAVSFSIDRLR